MSAWIEMYAVMKAAEHRRFAALPWYKKLWERKGCILTILVCLLISAIFWYGLYKGWQTFGPRVSIKF